MYEIKQSMGLAFLVRPNSVDGETLRWMSGSLFLDVLSATTLTEEDGVLDLGSHIGAFSLVAATRKHCRVLGFEPDKDSLKLSKANAVLNGLDYLADFHLCAVGGTDGTATLYRSDQNWGHMIFPHGGPYNRLTGARSTVPLASLDTILARVQAARRLLVKFNIEGAEFDMFEKAGMPALRRIDTFVGEVHYDLGLGDFSPCTAKLREAGFQVELVPQGKVRAILVAKRA